MTDADVLRLVHQLEQCRISPEEFHHRDHLAVAVAYLYSADFECAMEKIRATLLKFIQYHGKNGYHETLTRFWMLQVEQRIDRNECLHRSVERMRAALADAKLVYEFYTKERLSSVEAKEGWVEPDLVFNLRARRGGRGNPVRTKISQK